MLALTGLTLTGLYNVLEALRDGRPLTLKEKVIHTQGLVSVLKDLHDELDAAVLPAYGWDDLMHPLSQAQGERSAAQSERGAATDERGAAPAEPADLLTRLVALNTQRAAEEKAGRIRWLRPEFQNPQNPGKPAAGQLLSNQELITQVLPGLKADLAPNVPAPAAQTAPGLPAWPNTLPDQMRAVAQVLTASSAALPLAALEASFKGKGPWEKGLPRILETLEALGRARREGDQWTSH